jgi:hypothetical protein
MIKLKVGPVIDGCDQCHDPNLVSYSYSDEYLRVDSYGFHHEYATIRDFATQVKRLDERRTGEAILVSKCECSVFRLRFTRTGGDLQFACRLILDLADDDDWFNKEVSVHGGIDSERVSEFLQVLLAELSRANQVAETQ